MAKIDTTEIENIIHGKIEPHIYAFQTGTIPNYLKVGDTYRPVAMRLDEWRRPNFFPDLIPVDKTWSARLDETAYFRDFEVHQYLMREKHRERLTPALFPNAYFSKEFFKDATPLDVDEAVEDIESAYKTHSAKYSVYSLEEKHSQDNIYLLIFVGGEKDTFKINVGFCQYDMSLYDFELEKQIKEIDELLRNNI